MKTKRMMFNSPKTLHALLQHLTDQLIHYASYQIQSGAQVPPPLPPPLQGPPSHIGSSIAQLTQSRQAWMEGVAPSPSSLSAI